MCCLENYPEIYMKYNKVLIGGMACLVVLAGCSTSSIQPKGRLDYLNASSVNSLELPPDLTGRGSVDSNNRATQMLSEYQRQSANRDSTNRVLVTSDSVRIERSGDNRWIVANLPAEYVWSKSVQLMQEIGLPIETQNPEAGILESGWAENRADVPDTWVRQLLKSTMDNMFSSSTRDKFRIRLERGQKGQVLVYVTHYGMKEKTSGRDNEFHSWVDRPRDLELEAEVLSRLVVKLGGQSGKEIKVGNNIKVVDSGTGVSVNRPLTSVWQQVGNILDDGATFKVESQDSQNNSFVVLQLDPKKKEGSKLAFWKSKKPVYYRFNVRLTSQGKDGTMIQIDSMDGKSKNEMVQRLKGNLH